MMNRIKKPYLFRVFIYITIIAVSAPLLMGAFSLYNNYINILEANDHDARADIAKTAMNIKYENDMYSGLAFELFSSYQVKSIMYDPTPDRIEILKTVMRVKSTYSVLTTNIKHFYIYNGTLGQIYSTKGNYTSIPKEFSVLLENMSPRKPSGPQIVTGDDGKMYFRYSVYEYIGTDLKPIGAFFMDINADWLFDILDTSLNSEYEGTVLLDAGQKPIITHVPEDTDLSGKTAVVEGKKYNIYSYPIANTTWTLKKLQYEENSLTLMKEKSRYTYLATMILLLLMPFLAMAAAHRLYRPVSELIQNTGAGTSPGSKKQSEFTYLQNIFLSNKEKLLTLETDIENKRNEETRQSYWKYLLQTGHHKSGYEANEDWEAGKHRLYIISCERSAAEPMEIALDHTLVVPMSASQLVVISEEAHDFMPEAQSLAAQTGLIVSSSDAFESIDDASEAYFQARALLNYSFLLGSEQVLTEEYVNRDGRIHEIGVENTTGKSIRELLFEGDLERIMNLTENACQLLKKMNYSNVVVSLTSIIISIKIAVQEMNQSRILPIDFNAAAYIVEMDSFDTIDDYMTSLTNALCEIVRASKISSEAMNDVRAETYKRYILANYANPDLSAQTIADHFGISLRQLNRIFKPAAGASVNEFLTDTRLQQAAKLMKNRSMSAQDAAFAVGILNTNYFYTLFKNKFGVTTKEYQISCMKQDS